MKKIIALSLALVMLFALVACGNKNTPAQTDTTPAQTDTTPAQTDTTPAPAEESTPDAAELVSAAFIDPIADWSQYDALIAQIKAETDFAKRTELMHQAEDILMATWCPPPRSVSSGR